MREVLCDPPITSFSHECHGCVDLRLRIVFIVTVIGLKSHLNSLMVQFSVETGQKIF